VRLQRNARPGSPLETNDGGVDARWRGEGASVEAPGDRDLEPSPPVGRAKCCRADRSVFRGELPLHDHGGPSQGDGWVAEQAGEDGPRPCERQVCDDGERLARPYVFDGVGLYNTDGGAVPEAFAQSRREGRIPLEHENASAHSSKCVDENAGASPDLEDQIASLEVGFSDEVAGELLTSKEVLAGRSSCGSPTDGHGTSPSSSSVDPRTSGPGRRVGL